MMTLDNTERTLEENMLVIADEEKAVAIAGVMGGLDTSVTEATQNVLFEAASFEPVTVRKTSKKLALQSDSSYRFERGTNIDNVSIALNAACKFAKELANGQPVRGICDIYPKPEVLKQIKVRTKRLNRLVGINLTTAQIETFLLRFKIETRREGEDLIANVPPYRHDITQEVDIIEEVARLNIPETLPAVASTLQLPTALQKLEKRLKDHLVSNGFSELITYSFIPANLDGCFHEKKPLMLKNALSEEMKAMRTSLKWNMFDAIRRNVLNDEYNLKFFEIGKVFHTSVAGLSEEHTRLSVGFCGSQNCLDWHDSKKEFDLFSIKGFVQTIADMLKIKVRFAPSLNSIFHPTMQMDVLLGKNAIGSFGQIHPNLLDNKKLPKNIFIVELDLDKLSDSIETAPRMKPIPEFPAIRRDLALLAPVTVAHRDIQKILVAEGGNLLEDCHLFDVYQGKGIQEGFRSLAYSLSFRDAKKTLTDNEVQPLVDKMVAKLEKNNIKLR